MTSYVMTSGTARMPSYISISAKTNNFQNMDTAWRAFILIIIVYVKLNFNRANPFFAKSCNLSPWSRYLTLCLCFLTCKVRLRNTYLIGAVMRIRGVNIAKYLTQSLVVDQLLSPVWLFVTPWTAACQASLSFTISWSLLKLMFIKSVILSNHLILCCPLLFLPSISPSISIFSNNTSGS